MIAEAVPAVKKLFFADATKALVIIFVAAGKFN